MNKIEPQKYFSELYQELNNSESNENGDLKNPFNILTNYEVDSDSSFNVSDFNDALKYQIEARNELEYAFECFSLEFTLLKHKNVLYLNQVVDFIYNYYEMSLLKNDILTNLIIGVFELFCKPPYTNYLNNRNRKRLSKWYEVKEPIKSFTLKIMPEDKWFSNQYSSNNIRGFKNSLISTDTSFNSFKALFDGKYLENKINWIDKKSSLCYFIKQLIASKLIVNPRNKHWEIVAEFFLINGEPIKQSELLNQKVTTNKDKIRRIDSFIHSLSNYYS